MKRLELYSGNKTYMYPDGSIASPARIESDFPALTVFAHVIQTDDAGQVCCAIDNFAALKSQYEIPPTLSDADALAAIEELLNAPPEEPGISAEERIASALEYQVMASLPDEEGAA